MQWVSLLHQPVCPVPLLRPQLIILYYQYTGCEVYRSVCFPEGAVNISFYLFPISLQTNSGSLNPVGFSYLLSRKKSTECLSTSQNTKSFYSAVLSSNILCPLNYQRKRKLKIGQLIHVKTCIVQTALSMVHWPPRQCGGRSKSI